MEKQFKEWLKNQTHYSFRATVDYESIDHEFDPLAKDIDTEPQIPENEQPAIDQIIYEAYDNEDPGNSYTADDPAEMMKVIRTLAALDNYNYQPQVDTDLLE